LAEVSGRNFLAKSRRRIIEVSKKLKLIVHAAEEKKASDIVVLQMQEGSGFTDYFVVCSGTSNTQMKVIVEEIQKRLKRAGLSTGRNEADKGAFWFLLDCGDIICHIFSQDARRFYDLEHLWSHASRLKV